MKTKIFYLTLTFLSVSIISNAQVEVNSHDIDIVPSASAGSELVINDASPVDFHTVHIVADQDVNGSKALYAEAFNVTGFGDIVTAIYGNSTNSVGPSFSRALFGSSNRATPSSDGRTYGVYGQAGNATPGYNYGTFGLLLGSNEGTAVLGYDAIAEPGWNQNVGSCTYAGYFRGKGYFHGNLGLGNNNPQTKLHVNGGDIYVQGSANGVILDSGSGCYLVTVDAAGVLQTTSVTCP